MCRIEEFKRRVRRAAEENSRYVAPSRETARICGVRPPSLGRYPEPAVKGTGVMAQGSRRMAHTPSR